MAILFFDNKFLFVPNKYTDLVIILKEYKIHRFRKSSKKRDYYLFNAMNEYQCAL